MQIENTGTCIISGSSFVPEEKKADKPKVNHINKTTVKIKPSFNFSFIRSFGRDLRIVMRKSRKKTACTLGGVAVSAAAFYALSTYCTIGVNCYYNDKLICTVAASDNAAAIIGSAMKKADMMGVTEPEIETSAKIALKSSITKGEDAVESILSAAPGLTKGYIVSVDGIDLFVTDSRETVDEVLSAYVDKYKLNDKAELSSDFEIREKIVRKDEITPTDYIPALLDEGNVLTVMNTVDFTQQETIVHETQEIPDENLYIGESVVETEGSDGIYVTVDRQIFSNGELLSSSIISGETSVEPITEVVRVGTKMKNVLKEGLNPPVEGIVSSNFGPRWGRQHRGVDIAVDMNTPVAAAGAGTVITAQYKESYGNLVQIDHGYGIITSYAHLNTVDVSVGQIVQKGEIVAHSGNTGNSTGPHLHFEIINNGKYLNPLDYVKVE